MRLLLLLVASLLATACDTRPPVPPPTPTTVVAMETQRLQPKESRTIALRASVTVRGPTATPAPSPTPFSGAESLER